MDDVMIGDEATRVLSGHLYGDEINVRCPYCEGDYTHIDSCGTLFGTDKYEAGIYVGTSVVGKTMARRSALEIVMRCEVCPDKFAIILQQHKGVTLIEIRKDTPCLCS